MPPDSSSWREAFLPAISTEWIGETTSGRVRLTVIKSANVTSSCHHFFTNRPLNVLAMASTLTCC